MIRLSLSIVTLVLLSVRVFGQGPDPAFVDTKPLPSRVFRHITGNAARMEKMLAKRTGKYLDEMQKEEMLLQRALPNRDSLAAKSLFAGSTQQYQTLRTSLFSPSTLPALKEYLPMVDSIHTAMRFLGKTDVADELQELEGRWQLARDAESFIRQREQQLSRQLAGLGLGKSLLSVNRTAFYFQQQLAEYKSLLQDKDKAQEKVLNSVRNLTAFQNFMQKNSYVGRLFRLPDNYGSTASLAGLQTKELVQQRLGLGNVQGVPGNGSDPGPYIQQKVDNGQQQIGQLKTKLRSLGHFSGGGDMVMPRFNPNDQKVKSFLKRIVYGLNIQTGQSYGLMPVTANLGLLLGYKLSSKATIGLGGSYNAGLGQGLSRLSYSGQGIGLRSFIDIKARGSLWVTGGWEYNFVRGFSTWQQLRHWDQWQKSALFGLTKKFQMSPNRNSSVQLLFDALYKQHAPASAPLVFRVGYNFN